MKKINIICTFCLTMAFLMIGCGQDKGETAGSSKGKAWEVMCVDQLENPVEGVTLQFCTDKICTNAVTDEDGIASFEGDKGKYSIHVAKTPHGYEYDGDEIEASFGDEVIIELSYSEEDEVTAEETTDTADADEEPAAEVPEEPEESETEDIRTGERISFSTVDKDGNPVDDSIFSDYKLIMINIWEPWCGPCKNEMPDLERLYQEYKDEGFLILGVHGDNENLGSVLKSTGVTYPILDTQDVFMSIVNVTGGYPSTVFVDSEGYVLGVTEEELEETINTYLQYYQDDLEAYVNGDLDEYINDPDYSDYKDYFDLLEEAASDPSVLAEAARNDAESELSGGYFIGSADYDTWKSRIDARLDI